MLGYWNKKDETNEVIKEGWLHTGDIGEFTKEGNLKITDRKKEIIVNLGGDNISPSKIENLLCLNEKIKVYKKIDKIYINNFDSINNNKISLMDLELFDDFSEIFLLIQKIEEIDFKIKLNSWKSDLKKCENYSKYIEFKNLYY